MKRFLSVAFTVSMALAIGAALYWVCLPTEIDDTDSSELLRAPGIVEESKRTEEANRIHEEFNPQ